MFVVDFVRFANRPEIYIIGPFEPIKSPMNKNIVYQKIRKTVKRYS